MSAPPHIFLIQRRVCGGCFGAQEINGRTCHHCQGTGFQDQQIPFDRALTLLGVERTVQALCEAVGRLQSRMDQLANNEEPMP